MDSGYAKSSRASISPLAQGRHSLIPRRSRRTAYHCASGRLRRTFPWEDGRSLPCPHRDRPFAMPSGVGGTVSAVLPFTAEGSRVSAFEATPPLTAGGARRSAAGGGRSLPFAHVEHGRSSADFRQEIQDASRCLSRACARPQRLTLRGRKGQGPFPEDCPPCRKKTPSSCCSARAC